MLAFFAQVNSLVGSHFSLGPLMSRLDKMKISKGKESQQRILKAALKLFSKKGVEGTSIQEIADRSKLAQSAVLYHFSSKNKLYIELMKQVVLHNHDLVSNQMKPDMNAKEKLKKHFAANLLWAIENPEKMHLLLLLYYYAGFDKTFSKYYRELQSRARARVHEHLLAAHREKLLTAEPSPDLASFLHDILLGGVVNFVTSGAQKSSAQKLIQQWDEFLEKL